MNICFGKKKYEQRIHELEQQLATALQKQSSSEVGELRGKRYRESVAPAIRDIKDIAAELEKRVEYLYTLSVHPY